MIYGFGCCGTMHGGTCSFWYVVWDQAYVCDCCVLCCVMFYKTITITSVIGPATGHFNIKRFNAITSLRRDAIVEMTNSTPLDYVIRVCYSETILFCIIFIVSSNTRYRLLSFHVGKLVQSLWSFGPTCWFISATVSFFQAIGKCASKSPRLDSTSNTR